MRILFVGDIFGGTGRRVLSERLKDLKDKNNVDVCIANAENAAGGKGITLNILKKLNKYGVNVVTGGNHSMVQEEVYSSVNSHHYLLRPLNLYNENRGMGYTIYILPDGRKIGVINLLGRTFFDAKINCPFKFGMDTIKTLVKETSIIIVDFHAEATSEKVCLANYLDGLASAVIGTHTHVQTCDERILRRGTAFITDVGMTGPEDSAIGMKLKPVIQKYLYQSHIRFEVASKGPMFNGVLVDINDNTGKARGISRIFERLIFK